MHQSSRYLIGFSYEKSAGHRYRQCFLLDKPCRKTIFSAVLRQQRKSDVMTSFGHSAHSAAYYKAGSPVFCYLRKHGESIAKLESILYFIHDIFRNGPYCFIKAGRWQKKVPCDIPVCTFDNSTSEIYSTFTGKCNNGSECYQ
jgi:hypothetical protein